jgi:hypothetical protein
MLLHSIAQNSAGFFDEKNLPHAIEVDLVLGSKFVIMGSPGRVANLDGWKAVALQIETATCLRAGDTPWKQLIES